MGIDIEYIKQIIKTNREEDYTLDYKQELKISNDEDKNELRKDVCAFANASGGLILIGVKEPKEKEQCKVVGLQEEIILRRDDIKASINQILTTRIEPKITSFQVDFLDIDDRTILGINIQPSYLKPHGILYNDKYKVPVRVGNKSDPMNFMQIKDQILIGNNTHLLIRSYIDQRLNLIENNEIPFSFDNRYLIVLHICPYEFFSSIENFDLKNNGNFLLGPMSIALGGHNLYYSIDGLYRSNSAAESYCLQSRNGCLEYVFFHRNESFYEKDLHAIFNTIHRSLKYYRYENITSAININLTLLNAKGVSVGVEDYFSSIHPYERYSLRLPLLQISQDELCKIEIPSYYNSSISQHNSNKDVTWDSLKPLFDCLYQSFGFDSCIYHLDNFNDCY